MVNNKKYGIGVIGTGYWGPNLVKTFEQIKETEVISVADLSTERRDYIKKLNGDLHITESHSNVISNPSVDVVVIATPPHTHYTIAKEALLNNKHVFIEKPFTTSADEAESLLEISSKLSLRIGVGHLFTFHPAIEIIKSTMQKLNGFSPYYINFQRANLPPSNPRLNVIWDLAVHDIAVSNFLLNDTPKKVFAKGYKYSHEIIDMANIILEYNKNYITTISVGWHTSNKIRSFQFFGKGWSLFFDDLAEDNKLIIFDKGIDTRLVEGVKKDEKLHYGINQKIIPTIPKEAPLLKECKNFISAISENSVYRNDAKQGLLVVKICHAIEKSISSEKFEPV